MPSGGRRGRKDYLTDGAAGHYVVGAVRTRTIERFWSLVKCGMVGTFHKVSAKYLRRMSPSSSSGITNGRTQTSSERRWQRVEPAISFSVVAIVIAGRLCRADASPVGSSGLPTS